MGIHTKTDIDIDTKNRDELLSLLEGCYTPATERITDDGLQKHKSGVYFDNIPKDPTTGLASIDYKEAEDLGYQKVDFLNVRVYENVRDRKHLEELLERPVQWEAFTVPEIIGELFQLGNQVSTVLTWPPTSIEELAMLIAMIRPAKRHLIGCDSWDKVREEIWEKPTNGEAYFKKSHAFAYSMAIVVQLNALIEVLENEQPQSDQ